MWKLLTNEKSDPNLEHSLYTHLRSRYSTLRFTNWKSTRVHIYFHQQQKGWANDIYCELSLQFLFQVIDLICQSIYRVSFLLVSEFDDLLSMTALSAVQSFAWIPIHNTILFINTSSMLGTTKSHWLTGRPYLAIFTCDGLFLYCLHWTITPR